MLVGGLIWYFRFHEHFLERAHIASAFGLFGVVGVVMGLNALDRGKNSRPLRRFYAGTALAMVLAVVVTLAVKAWIVDEWEHQVLVLELLEMAAFVAYWAVQTVQHWDEGIKGAPPAPPAAAV